MLRSKNIDDGVAVSEARRDFYGRAKAASVAPLWEVLAGLVPAAPKPEAIPHNWRYRDVRKYLMEACDLLTAEEAERRVMVLENPALPGRSRVTESLFCGMQAILPGEVAPVHRHVAGASRFIVEGSNAYTAVDGERTMMEPGDFVLTPSWSWHDHGNLSDAPMVWLDTLDMHMVNLFNTSFREEAVHTQQNYSRPDDASISEFASGMRPAGFQPKHKSSPIVNYKYSRTREALKSLQSHAEIDPHFGYMINFVDPTNGDWALPTLAAQMRLLPKGFQSRPHRSTESLVLSVVEGIGTSKIGDQEFNWEQGDTLIVPSWLEHTHLAETEAVLFSISDRSAQEKLGLFREQER